MDIKEIASPPPTTASSTPPSKGPSLPQSINVEPTFIYEKIAREKGISLEKAKEWFNNLPDPKPKPEEKAQIVKNQTVQKDSFWTKKISRREAVGLGIAGAATIATAAAVKNPSLVRGIWNWVTQNREKRLQQSQPEVITPKVEAKPESIYKTLNEINALPVTSIERKTAEVKYVKQAQTLEQINLGFYVVTNWDQRIILLEKLHQKRQAGEAGLKPSTPQEKTWAEEENRRMSEESLAPITEAYFWTRTKLENKMAEYVSKRIEKGGSEKQGRRDFWEFYRLDLIREVELGKLPPEVIDNLQIEDILPSVGTVAAIAYNESRAGYEGGTKWYPLTFMGKVPIIKAPLGKGEGKNKEEDAEIRSRLLADHKEHLDDLNKEADKPENFLKLKYVQDNTLASDLTGDLGSMQFRPDTGLRVHQFIKKNFDLLLHPYSLEAVKAVYLFLASGSVWREEATGEWKTQYGFINETLKNTPATPTLTKKLLAIQKDSLIKWNPSMVDNILNWRASYKKAIIDTGVFAQIDQSYQKAA